MPDGEELSGVGRTSGARNELVAELMKEAVERGTCPFCSPYFEAVNGDRVIEFDDWRPKHWKVWHNPSPLPGTSYHLMLAPNEHWLLTSELLSEARYERDLIIERLQLKFGYESFTEFSRQGNPAFNSATVYHLHYHIVVSSGEPASDIEIPAPYMRIVDQVLEKLDFMASRTGDDVLELLDALREYLDIYREGKRGKAIPIRAKFSNKVGLNQTDNSQ